MSFATGIGWDSHRLVEGRPLILGGVRIEHDRGLAGHSDADVLCHAVIDALLGAAGLGDIGEHFPDDDPRWKDADSLALLSSVHSLLAAEGWVVTNIDASVLLERPKLRPHRVAMREALAGAIGISPERVNVKATTGEGMGFVGREEGVGALAVATIVGG
ncbi:MAG: 2-C-methyl-D-erythritol 2,4-cyclodiphosphate synthase [Actinomycetota bacterium]|nr:2-C-methyl-D-erythritol 2,4-cyclodiphosphate synthase [Actinomycetota bacterium]MDQ3372196.1 2-C-methyl-D-erythritol 2,4-cyclodiphosphate synthase [Actinomycetota bacterium]MDQ3409655.1 2-C-methyl-D-erythritol 2,4-cyclodiphosphate synthase [Actinomycetota bacterium]